MIKITKPAAAPAILQTRGRAKRAEHCRQYKRKSTEYDSGQLSFTFNATIYGDATVKEALIAAQYGKCCFCERKVSEEGDVEHYRPKASYSQGRGKRLERPGYYWLAYDWDNLLLSCSICNQRHKRNYFPLIDPSLRARSHKETVSREQPLFINPVDQDPEEFISFRKEIPYAVGGNPHGSATIKELSLDRATLNEERRDYLKSLIYLRKVLDQANVLNATLGGREILKEADDFLAAATQKTSRFTAMARAAAKKNFRISLP